LDFFLIFTSCEQREEKLTPKDIAELSIICDNIVAKTKIDQSDIAKISKEDLGKIKRHIPVKDAYTKTNGIYLVCHSKLFGKETGYFYLNNNSEFKPELSIEPTYKKISDRLYLYTIHD